MLAPLAGRNDQRSFYLIVKSHTQKLLANRIRLYQKPKTKDGVHDFPSKAGIQFITGLERLFQTNHQTVKRHDVGIVLRTKVCSVDLPEHSEIPISLEK